MSKIITIKLTKASIRSRLFNIFDQYGNAIASSVDRDSLVNGMSFTVDSSMSSVKIVADNGTSKLKTIGVPIYASTLTNTKFENAVNGCLWRHLTRVDLDRKSTRLNSSHSAKSRMPSSA